MEQRRLLLIAGIPGTGKRTIGNYLQNKYQFKHLDFEVGNYRLFLEDPQGFIEDNLNSQYDIVISWGFVPNEFQIEHVKYFGKLGYKHIWFDGDRESALREYLKAGRPEELFHVQLRQINESGVIQVINPVQINTFTNKKFRNK